MELQNESSGSETHDAPSNNGEFQWVPSLNEERYKTICTVLRGQSLRDEQAFKERVQQLQDQGYPLTSLVVEMRYLSAPGLPRIWKCQVRTKNGAKPETIRL